MERQYYQYCDAKLLYRERYCGTYNYVITCIKGRLDQPEMLSLLSKSRNHLLYQEKNDTVAEIYRDDFNALV